MTFEGTRRRCCLDGQEVFASGPEIGDTLLEGPRHFVVGSHSVHAPGEFFVGTIDEVAMCNDVLTEEDIRCDMDGVFRQFTAVRPRDKLATACARLKGL